MRRRGQAFRGGRDAMDRNGQIFELRLGLTEDGKYWAHYKEGAGSGTPSKGFPEPDRVSFSSTSSETDLSVRWSTTPSDATKVDLVIQGFGSRFSILARSGADLKFGKEDATHDGSSEAQRYVRYMADPHVKGACPF
jgi:hypothetical protein